MLAPLLIQLFPILMKIILFTIIILFVLNFKSFSKLFKSIKTKTWILLVLILLCGLTMRMFFIPHTHHVYSDEFEHINIAQNILYSENFCECFAGSNQDCRSCYLMPLWPPGYHTFLSLVFGVFGDSEEVAFNTNAIIGSLSIVLIFLLIFLIFKDPTLALIISFIFSFIPVYLKYSGTSSLGIFSIFFILLSMIFLETYVKTKKYKLFLLFLITLLYAIHIRLENFLLLFVFTFYLLIKLKSKHQIKNIIKGRYLLSIIIFLLMLIPLTQLIYARFNISNFSPVWGNNLPANFISNLLFFINPKFNSIIFTILCILGCIILYSKNKKELVYYSFFLMLFFIMYSFYQNGNIMTFGDIVRYSLILYLPLMIISVNGIYFILKSIPLNKKILVTVLTLLFLISLVPTQEFIFSKSSFEREYKFILSMKNKLPSDTYIISYNTPTIISTLHKKSISPYVFFEHFDTLEKKDNVILFKDFWWYEKLKESNEFENELKKYYSFQVIEKDSNYGFYNLTLK